MRTRADAIPDTTTVTRKLLEYCRSQGWAGYDPYDALNSPLLTSLPRPEDVALFDLLLPNGLRAGHSLIGLMRPYWGRDDFQRAERGQLRFEPGQAMLIRRSLAASAAN